jgi:hypothetical protein
MVLALCEGHPVAEHRQRWLRGAPSRGVLWYGRPSVAEGGRTVMQTAIEIRRWAGKLVLFLALCWVLVLISLLSGAARGASVPPLDIALAVLPGCAFGPAAISQCSCTGRRMPSRLAGCGPGPWFTGSLGWCCCSAVRMPSTRGASRDVRVEPTDLAGYAARLREVYADVEMAKNFVHVHGATPG